jgi:hypothetical protein
LLLPLPIAFLLSKNVFDGAPYAKASSRNIYLSEADKNVVKSTADEIKVLSFAAYTSNQPSLINFLHRRIVNPNLHSLQPKNTHMKKRCTRLIYSGLTTFLILVALLANSQTRTITGKVMDATGNQSLEGVTVQAKGTQAATVTGSDGTFSINVPAGARALIFTFVGFQEQEVAIGNSNTLTVTLTPGGQSLQDVVVIGYGTARKSDLTGAVSSVKAAQLQGTPSLILKPGISRPHAWSASELELRSSRRKNKHSYSRIQLDQFFKQSALCN